MINRQTKNLARLVDGLFDVARVTTAASWWSAGRSRSPSWHRALQAATAAGKTAHHHIT